MKTEPGAHITTESLPTSTGIRSRLYYAWRRSRETRAMARRSNEYIRKN
jgi:ribosomal protein S4E